MLLWPGITPPTQIVVNTFPSVSYLPVSTVVFCGPLPFPSSWGRAYHFSPTGWSRAYHLFPNGLVRAYHLTPTSWSRVHHPSPTCWSRAYHLPPPQDGAEHATPPPQDRVEHTTSPPHVGAEYIASASSHSMPHYGLSSQSMSVLESTCLVTSSLPLLS